MNRFGIFLFLVCGLMLPGECNGASFHKPLFASVCGFCGKAIYDDYISYENGAVYHRKCHELAKRCKMWHKRCFENARFCGITGHYIKPGVATVRIGSEIFIKSEYDKSPKCLVSALLLANHGTHIVNRQSKSYVPEKYKAQTHQCYSCEDWLPDGYILGEAILSLQLLLPEFSYKQSAGQSTSLERQALF